MGLTLEEAKTRCALGCDSREDCMFAELYYTDMATCYLRGSECGDWETNMHPDYHLYRKDVIDCDKVCCETLDTFDRTTCHIFCNWGAAYWNLYTQQYDLGCPPKENENACEDTEEWCFVLEEHCEDIEIQGKCPKTCNQCNGPSSCNPSFIDVHGSSCEDYSRLNFCTSEGGYGIGWNIQIFGEFDNYSVNGETAFLCPECGCKE